MTPPDKGKTALWRQEYEAALAAHLKKGGRSGAGAAEALGRRASQLGLTTLDLARIHQASVSLGDGPAGRSRARAALAARSEAFFLAANAQVERSLQELSDAKQLSSVHKALQKRTADLAVAKNDVKERIIERKADESNLKTTQDHYAKLWRESCEMQMKLRRLAHRVLRVQERERGIVSQKLRNEIAQVLTGINIRLYTLQQQSAKDASKLLAEIEATGKLVAKSIKQMRRSAAQVSKGR